MAHPIWYTPEAVQLAERGATLAEISEAMGVTIRSLSRWRNRYAEFNSALLRGRKRRTPQWAAGRRSASRDREAALKVLALISEVDVAARPVAQHEKPAGELHRLRGARAHRGETYTALEHEHRASPDWSDTAGAPIPLDDPLAGW